MRSRSQDEISSSAKANPNPVRFKMGENAAENLQLRELRSTGTLPDHASYEAVSSAVTPERGAIRSQDEISSSAKANSSPVRFKMGENAAEKLRLRELLSTGNLQDHASYEAASSAAMQEEGAIRSKDEISSSAKANSSLVRLKIGENAADKLQLREVGSNGILSDRAALHIPASFEAVSGNETSIQGQRTGYGSHLKKRKQNAWYPSISSSLKGEDDSISSPQPVANVLYENDSLPHPDSRKLQTSIMIPESARFTKKLKQRGINRKMLTSKMARKDDDYASMIRNPLQHDIRSFQYEGGLAASDSAAKKSEPRPLLQPSARSHLQSGVQRFGQRAPMVVPNNIKSEVEGDIASRSMVHKTNQSTRSFNRMFSATDTAQSKVEDEIDLQGDLSRSGILNPDSRMVQAMMPLGPPAKRHESATRRNFANLDSDNATAVHVTIGRIEVRAVTSPEPQKKRESPETVGLDEYLRERSGGKR